MMTTLLILLAIDVVLGAANLGLRIYERHLAKRLAAEQARTTALKVQADRELLDRLEKENLAGPKNPAVTALIAGARDEIERSGNPMSGRTRTFVMASTSQLGDINDLVSGLRLQADLLKKKGTT